MKTKIYIPSEAKAYYNLMTLLGRLGISSSRYISVTPVPMRVLYGIPSSELRSGINYFITNLK